MEAGKSKVYRVDWQAGGQGKTDAVILVQRQCVGRILFNKRGWPLSMKAFHLLDETHPHLIILEPNLLFSKSTDLHVSHF